MIENKLIKKGVFLIALIFLFYSSYILKNFQLLLISINFLLFFTFFFKIFNKNILTILFSCFFIFTIIELSLFYTNEKKIFKIKNKKNISENIKYKKTFLGYQPVSGIQKHKIISNGKIIIDSQYTIDNDNFRFTPKIDNLVKNKTINFFGGSFIFGWGLNDDETLPYSIQKYFKDWNIKNYGISGYGVHQMLAQITESKKIIKDINILITHKFHVPRSACKRDFSFGTPKYILKKNKIIRNGYCNYTYFNKIQFPRIIGSIVNRSEIKRLIDKLYSRKVDFDNKDIDLYLSIIYEINKMIKKKNKLFFIGYIIDKKNEVDNYILSELTKNNIEVIDLSLDPDNDKFRLPDQHPSKEANEERSLIIWKYLSDN